MQKASFIVPYSAMAQGQAVSVLVRAFSITKEQTFFESASLGLEFMLKPVRKGGTCRQVPEGLVFEEYIRGQPKTVLNGWINDLYGLYDFLLIAENTRAYKMLYHQL